MTTMGPCPPPGDGWASFSSMVTITVLSKLVNQLEDNTGARFFCNHVSPCVTVPSCMSSARFGVTQTNCGAAAPFRSEISPALPGYGTTLLAQLLLSTSLKETKGSCLLQ